MATIVKPPKKPVVKIIKKRVSAMPSYKRDELDREIQRWDSDLQSPKDRIDRRKKRLKGLIR